MDIYGHSILLFALDNILLAQRKCRVPRGQTTPTRIDGIIPEFLLDSEKYLIPTGQDLRQKAKNSNGGMIHTECRCWWSSRA